MKKQLQGLKFSYPYTGTNTSSAKMILKSDTAKITLTTLEIVDGLTYFVETDTDEWASGIYKFQIMDTKLIEEGELEVLVNYSLLEASASVQTTNENCLEAIEAVLAGRASATQASMSVGDKSIQYLTVDELLKLRDYFVDLIAAERGKRTSGDGGKIQYQWNIR